jgi:hypothetical protein
MKSGKQCIHGQRRRIKTSAMFTDAAGERVQDTVSECVVCKRRYTGRLYHDVLAWAFPAPRRDKRDRRRN